VAYISTVRRGQPRDCILDAWRGIAVSLVVGYHAVRFTGGVSGTSPLGHSLHAMGALGVQIFLAISGYLITAHLAREQHELGRPRLSAFYLRRACRILPAFLIFLLAVGTLALLGAIALDVRSWFTALLFGCNLTRCDFVVGHTWSLAVEEQYYLVWPLVWSLASGRFAIPLAIVVALAGAVIAPTQSLTAIAANNYAAFACLACGSLYAASDRTHRLLQTLARPELIVIAVLALLLPVLVTRNIPVASTLERLLHPALVTFAVFAPLRYRRHLESRALVTVFARVGLVSYSIYLWQQLFLAPGETYHGVALAHWPLLLTIPALLSFALIEQPAIALGRRLTATTRPPRAGDGALETSSAA